MAAPKEVEPFGEIVNRHTGEIRKAIEGQLDGKEIADQDVPAVVDDISKRCLEVLREEKSPYKIVAHCALLRKAPGCHYYAASSCLWENQTDGGVSVRWDSETMMCAVTVFGLRN